MLYLHHQECPSQEVLRLETGFIHNVQHEWLIHPLVKKIIETVDRLVVCAPNLYESPEFGALGPTSLSDGSKLLIWMLNEPQYIFPMGYMGQNCAHMLKLVSDCVDCHLQFQNYIINFEKDQKFISPNGTPGVGFEDVLRLGNIEGWY